MLLFFKHLYQNFVSGCLCARYDACNQAINVCGSKQMKNTDRSGTHFIGNNGTSVLPIPMGQSLLQCQLHPPLFLLRSSTQSGHHNEQQAGSLHITFIQFKKKNKNKTSFPTVFMYLFLIGEKFFFLSTV